MTNTLPATARGTVTPPWPTPVDAILFAEIAAQLGDPFTPPEPEPTPTPERPVRPSATKPRAKAKGKARRRKARR